MNALFVLSERRSSSRLGREFDLTNAAHGLGLTADQPLDSGLGSFQGPSASVGSCLGSGHAGAWFFVWGISFVEDGEDLVSCGQESFRHGQDSVDDGQSFVRDGSSFFAWEKTFSMTDKTPSEADRVFSMTDKPWSVTNKTRSMTDQTASPLDKTLSAAFTAACEAEKPVLGVFPPISGLQRAFSNNQQRQSTLQPQTNLWQKSPSPGTERTLKASLCAGMRPV